MRVHLTLIALLALYLVLPAQVRSDGRIELTGNDPASRQVMGLPSDQQGNAALSAGVELSGSYRFALATVDEAWQITLPALMDTPTPGTHLLVKVPQYESDSALLTVNGLGPFPVVLNAYMALAPSDVPDGTVLSLVFDGTRFHVMNGTVRAKRSCPAGMVAGSQHYCIDIQEREPPEIFSEAARRCGEQGLRLCSWSEFHQACILSATLGLQQMTGNFEWSDTAANEDYMVRAMGEGSCTWSAVWVGFSRELNYRCCYTR